MNDKVGGTAKTDESAVPKWERDRAWLVLLTSHWLVGARDHGNLHVAVLPAGRDTRACRKSVQGRGPLPHPAGHSVLWDLA
jgi:hypothetical protein